VRRLRTQHVVYASFVERDKLYYKLFFVVFIMSMLIKDKVGDQGSRRVGSLQSIVVRRRPSSSSSSFVVVVVVVGVAVVVVFALFVVVLAVVAFVRARRRPRWSSSSLWLVIVGAVTKHCH